jgi:hypothetical protein
MPTWGIATGLTRPARDYVAKSSQSRLRICRKDKFDALWFDKAVLMMMLVVHGGCGTNARCTSIGGLGADIFFSVPAPAAVSTGQAW